MPVGPTPGPGTRRRPDRDLAVPLSVAAGGALGGTARWSLTVAWPHAPGGWPWSTLVANVLGSLLIGVVLAMLLELSAPHRLLRPFLATGVLGGFTTFSTFSADTLALLRADLVAEAALYVTTSVVLCLLGTLLGVAAARWMARRATGAMS